MLKALQGTIAAAVIGSTAFFGFGPGGDAQAAPHQDGLVNVFLSDTTVQVPIALAANICDVSVNALAIALEGGETVDCGAFATATAEDSDSESPSQVRQSGLVNIAATDTTIQVPLGVALNICDLDVNVLARTFALGNDPFCTADADGTAKNN